MRIRVHGESALKCLCLFNQFPPGNVPLDRRREVFDLLTNPGRLEREYHDSSRAGPSLENVETSKAQRLKLPHALERLIDSFTERLSEKDRFASRMARTKSRIAEVDTKIKDDAGDVDQLEHLRLAAKRLRDLAAAVGPHLANADWHRRRDIIRTLVQRIEIGQEILKIVFRVTSDTRGSGPESIVVTHCRGCRPELRNNKLADQDSPYVAEHESGVAVERRVLTLGQLANDGHCEVPIRRAS